MLVTFATPRSWSTLFAWSLCLLLAPLAAHAQRPASTKLFPKSTVAYVSFPNTTLLKERFLGTAMGQMTQDPQMKPLIEQIYTAVLEAAKPLEENIGLTLPEMLSIPQGEISVGVIAVKGAGPAFVALLDVGPDPTNVNKLLNRGASVLIERNATQQTETIEGQEFLIYSFVGESGRQVVYFMKDGTLAVGSNLAVMKDLLTAWKGGEAPSLADNEQFAAIAKSTQGAKGEEVSLKWFVDPINTVRSVGQNNSGVSLGLALLPALGLDGLLGVGGSITLLEGNFDVINRIHLYLDNPRNGVVEMVALGTGDVSPERWVPANAASYTTFYWDVNKTYNKAKQLVDSFQGDGAFKRQFEQAALDRLELDVERDVLAHVDGRFTTASFIIEPYTADSQVTLIGFKLKDAKAFQPVMDRMTAKYSEQLEKRSYGGKTFFEVQADFNFGPQVRFGQRGDETDPNQPQDPNAPKPPKVCFGIVGDYLLVSRAAGLERAIVCDNEKGNGLVDSLDYKLIASKAQRQSGGSKPALFNFNRPEEGLRFVYGLASAEDNRKRLAEAGQNNPFFKNLDQAMKDNPLPPFETIKKYLAPAGAVLIDDETGIHYTSFTLRRGEE